MEWITTSELLWLGACLVFWALGRAKGWCDGYKSGRASCGRAVSETEASRLLF